MAKATPKPEPVSISTPTKRTAAGSAAPSTNSAFDYHWIVWMLTGVHQPEWVPRWLYICYSIAINFFVTFLFPATLVANLFFTRNLRELCENLSITVTDISSNLKFINVFIVRKQLLQLKGLLSDLDARAVRSGRQEELDVLHDAVQLARRSFRIFAGIFIFGTTLSCVKVLIASERILLYPAWFGVDYRASSGIYTIVCLYQLFGLIVQAVQDCANDSYPPAYMCIITGHMRALELRVRSIGYDDDDTDAVEKMNENDVVAIQNKNLRQRQRHRTGQNLERWQRRSYHLFNNCIDDYVCVLRLHKTIQEILSIACLSQFLCTITVQCAVALHFLYVVDSADFSAVILSLIFFGAVTLEVFVICYFGDQMRTQSEALLGAFYGCNWFDQAPHFRRNMIITFIRAQNPSVIFAGGYVKLDLETFLGMMKFTYSAFTLLLRFK